MEIIAQNITKSYQKGAKALDNVTLTLRSPSLIGLVGPNGAGKTTLMKLLISELLPDGGGITADGEPLQKVERELKARLGYLPQAFGLYDELTVWQFLDYMAALKGVRERKKAIDAAMQQTGLEEKRKAGIRTLSGGQKQRVGIAQALLGNPELLILDEPTVGLDPEERVKFRNLFSKSAQDKLMLLSTHIIEDVQSICGRLIVIDKGRIVFDGAPEELIRNAQGHVGVYLEREGLALPEGCHVTARVNTARGVTCRMVARGLPGFAAPAEPSLEDAYLYLIEMRGGEAA